MDSTVDSLKWFFQQPSPRQVDESLFNEAMNVLFPKVLRVVFSLVPVMVVAAMTTALVIMIKTTDLQGELRMLTATVGIGSGKVLDVKVEKGSKGSVTYVYSFEFIPPARETNSVPVRGISFSQDKVASPGDVVQIEYLADDPRISRIAGCRMSFAPFATLIAIPFVGMSTAVIPMGILRYKKRWLRRLLVSGICVPGFIERVKPGPKGALTVEVRYTIDGFDVKTKTNLNGMMGRRQDRELLVALQESGRPAAILADREKPRSFFFLELLFRAREKDLYRPGI